MLNATKVVIFVLVCVISILGLYSFSVNKDYAHTGRMHELMIKNCEKQNGVKCVLATVTPEDIKALNKSRIERSKRYGVYSEECVK